VCVRACVRACVRQQPETNSTRQRASSAPPQTGRCGCVESALEWWVCDERDGSGCGCVCVCVPEIALSSCCSVCRWSWRWWSGLGWTAVRSLPES
jgi:hypothetical protein